MSDLKKFSDFAQHLKDRQRYFLDKDDDGHWYLINASYRKEWNDFRTSNEEKVPPFANMLNCNVSVLEFSNPLNNLGA